MPVRRSIAALLLVSGLIAALGASPALGVTSHAFDPQLSLTGDCTTDEVDEVADPSCPYQAFPDGPSEHFERPTGLALDSYGNLYVALEGPVGPSGTNVEKAHIDIFDPQGNFIGELHVEGPYEPRTLAVDSEGYLYVHFNAQGPTKLVRYDPDPAHYDPANGVIAYETVPTTIATNPSDYASLAVNPANDHLFVNFGVGHGPGDAAIQEFGSGEEGNPPLDPDVANVCCSSGPGLAIDASRERLYATDQPGDASTTRIVRVFELAAPHDLIETIDGSSTPEGSFVANGALGLAVDESTGNVYAYDEERLKVIYELTEDGQYLSSIKHSLSAREHKLQVVVDNGAHSPHGVLDAEGRYLWATAAPGGVANGLGHAFAFKPSHECPPKVESVSVAHPSESEALLQAEVEPCNLQSTYRLQYTTRAQFEETGFEGAQLAGEGTIPAGATPAGVAAGATGLSPGSAYVFRAVATNVLGEDEAQGSFKTYPTSPPSSGCANEALRSGPSTLLPDCRAYELVSPANTNGLAPFGIGGSGPLFLSPTASPAGDAVSFRIEGGIIPGSDGTGSLSGDPYLSTRGKGGWSTAGTGGPGSEFSAVETGGHSPDQAYSLWRGVTTDESATYLRFPDGHSELLGQGSLATDPDAQPDWIAPDGTHAIFRSRVKLEPTAFEGSAIYDRTADGVTHVVSLLPGDVTPSLDAFYRGASPDGRGVAFSIETAPEKEMLYLRYDDEETYEIGEDVTFEGIAEGGKRIFYLKEGKLLAFDTQAGTIPFASGVGAVVNVSPDGSAAYFVSTTKLGGENPLHQKAKAGKENLYLSREGQVSFLATVSEADVAGEGSNIPFNGLGLWAKYIDSTTKSGKSAPIGGLPADPSRSSADGGVLLFQTRTRLTPYDNAGQIEIYRYDSGAGSLICISCNPTERPADSGAILQPLVQDTFKIVSTWFDDRVENLTADGRRAFFETTEALVAGDIDGRRDVYEWEAGGTGSCTTPEGCLYLISSGRSSHDDYLYGVSADGSDVFLLTTDLLDPAHDPDETSSIYDARVNGGFAPASQSAECLGEACQPAASPPRFLTPASSTYAGSGNLRPLAAPRCPQAARNRRARGKAHCSRQHRKHHKPNRHSGRKHR